MPIPAHGTIIRRDEPTSRLLARDASRESRLADRLHQLLGNSFWEFPLPHGPFQFSSHAEVLLGVSSPARRTDFLEAFDIHDREFVDHEFSRLATGSIDAVTIRARLNNTRGDSHTIEMRAISLDDDEHRGGIIVGTLADPSKDRQLESRLLVGAFLDAPTRLPNLVLFEDLVSQSLQQSGDGAIVEITALRVDRYDQIEAAFGSDFMNRLMTSIASRFQQHLEPGETLARIGREMFGILREQSREGLANDRSMAISRAFGSPFHVGDQTLYVTVSRGIARGSKNTLAASLIQNATAAALHSRSLGIGGQQHYAPEIRGIRKEFVRRETELREAIERGEISLEYQPIVFLADGRLSGFEALARWTNREGQAVKPCDFIPLAEETGLIGPLGEWVLDQSIEQLDRWSRLGPMDPPQISVNLSRRQLIQPGFVDRVRDLLARASVSPARLCLEITESLVMEDADFVMGACRELRSLGVTIHIDDFGTGYSSLSTLPELPVDAIKLDRSFVAPLASDPRGERLVRGIIALAKSLDLSVTAEGIETPTQARLLREMGCEKGQGYLFGRSMDAERAGLFIRNSPVKVLMQ